MLIIYKHFYVYILATIQIYKREDAFHRRMHPGWKSLMSLSPLAYLLNKHMLASAWVPQHQAQSVFFLLPCITEIQLYI